MIFAVSFIFCFILSLFTLYVLVRHDFVLARKSLLLKEIFDTTFFAYIAFLVSGRVFYILGEPRFDYIHIIKFFYIFKFPGISFLAGLFGFGIVAYIVFSRKKILARIFDIYSLSLYPLFIWALATSYSGGYFLYFNILIFLLSCVFLGIGFYSYKNYTLKDGSVMLLFLCLVSIFTIVSGFANNSRVFFSFFSTSQVVSIVVFFTCSFFLLTSEGMFGKGKK